MENIYEVFEAISSGTVVARYLVNTTRVQKAIEVYKECLFLLNEASGNEKEPFISAYITIWLGMLKGYYLINDLTSVIECGRTLIALLRACGDRQGEGMLLGGLGNVYQSIGEYGRAEAYQKKALVIIKEIGDRKTEAKCY